jgi:ABC-2 type transport system permease protein
VYTAVSLGVSSLTDRRAFASIAVVFVLLGASISSGVLVNVAEFSDNWRILDPIGGTLEIAPRLFGDRSEDFRNTSTWLVVLGSSTWTALGAGLLIGRYRKLAAV